MSDFPSIEELRAKYADVINNEAITRISKWEEHNEDEECDEAAYLNRALQNSDALNTKIAEALANVR